MQQTISKQAQISHFMMHVFFNGHDFSCVPHSDEMKRRRDFYAENRVLEPGEVVETFNIAEDEIISLSIQFYERNR